MEVREYLSVRRAYNLVRQKMDSSERLTFAEFAILCRLSDSTEQLKTSDIAQYQGCLRPTMTHRTKHLASLGLIGREKGGYDRRNVVCVLTDQGREKAAELCEKTREQIGPGYPLSRSTAERICRCVDAMGSYNCMAGDLVLLGLLVCEDESATVGQLVEALGLLQPTVSMSVTALKEDGMVLHGNGEANTNAALVTLTDAGRNHIAEVEKAVKEIVVRRPRQNKGAAAE